AYFPFYLVFFFYDLPPRKCVLQNTRYRRSDFSRRLPAGIALGTSPHVPLYDRRRAVVDGSSFEVGGMAYSRAGALLLSLPMVSLLAILGGWFQHHDLKSISQLAR